MSDFDSKTPFFILGSGRCGSNYLRRLLSLHENIALTNEAGVLHFFFFCSKYASVRQEEKMEFHRFETHFLSGLVESAYNETVSRIFDRHAKVMIEEFYDATFPDRDFTHWGDKLPNPFAVLAARAVWPHTKLITLVRDPRDVVSSWRSYSRRPDILANRPHVAESTAKTNANDWQAMYSGIQRDAAESHVVRYEDLVRDPVGVTRRALEFLGLSLQDRHVAMMGEDDAFERHGTSATVEASMERWRRDLGESDVATIESICGELMRSYGYELSADRES